MSRFHARKGQKWTAQRTIKPKADRTSADGVTHASASEMRRWNTLVMLQAQGIIKDLRRQVRFPLFCGDAPILTPSGRQAVYTPDFIYLRNIDGVWIRVIEDHKGFMDPLAQFRIAVFEAAYKVKVTITK